MEKSEKKFKTLMDVLRHLQNAGYKIEKTKLYQDKAEGLIKVKKGKPISETEVLAYIVRAELEKIEESNPEAVDKDKAEKRTLEIENFRIKNKRLRFDFEKDQKKYIKITESNLNQVNLLVVLDLNFRQMVEEIMPDICSLLTGNMTKVNEAKNLAEEKWTDLLHDLTRVDSYTINCSEENNRDDS
ncbi:MAG: hypothetical protein GY714_12295 [Desulfobacterales bacterium]|nr:hypothetical protein [Desulfobacterales bacterium]